MILSNNHKKTNTTRNNYYSDFIINCIGILISESQRNIKKSIYLNALFPHLLNDLSFKLNFILCENNY